MQLQIEYVPISSICEYRNNTKIHTEEQISRIAESIEEFGFKDPIAIHGKDGVIIEGHGRYLAAKKLGMETVPIIRLDDLTEEQIRAYSIIHNKLNMDTGFDVKRVEIELRGITKVNMPKFGFSIPQVTFGDIPVFKANTVYESGSGYSVNNAPNEEYGGDEYDAGEYVGDISVNTDEEEIHSEFREYTEDIETTYRCPHCGFEWR